MILPSTGEIPEQLAVATLGWSKLRKMASYAAFDGWSLTVFGAITLICGGYGSAPGLLISVTLLGCGLFELRCVRQLRRLIPGAVDQLAYNQLILGGILIIYAIISLIQARHSGSAGGPPSEIEQAFAQTGGSTDDLSDQLSAIYGIFYIGVMAIAVLMQGGTAIFYRSRRPYLKKYLEETPAWIQQMQRERGNVSL